MNNEISVQQSYDDDRVVIKDVKVEFATIEESRHYDYVVSCKIKINKSDQDEGWLDYTIGFRERGQEPFDGFAPIAEREKLFKYIECYAHGNKYRVAYNLIDAPLSDTITDFENTKGISGWG